MEEELAQARAELEASQQEREAVKAELNSLSWLLPMCAWCKKIRDDDGYWQQVEGYLANRTDAEFSHAMCPDCFRPHSGRHARRQVAHLTG